MMNLETLLAHIPGLYENLEDACLPGRGGEPSDRSPDPRDKPAPGSLGVIEHRHKLVRGLRWWVDAVRRTEATRVETDHGPELAGVMPRPVGQSVRAMCAWLVVGMADADPEDRAELQRNLQDWKARAWGMVDPGPIDKDSVRVENIPPEAYARVVPVKDAAAILGCTVRTIQRRVPAEKRPAGMVVLGDAAPRCSLCDLIEGQCAHTRAQVSA